MDSCNHYRCFFGALFTVYKIYDSKNHPSKIVQEFEKAIEQEDSKKVAQLLNSGQDEIEVKENEVKTLFNYYEAHPDIYLIPFKYYVKRLSH